MATGPKRSLKELAENMQHQLAGRENGWLQMPLSGGLQVILQRNGARWRLALAREGVLPGETEIRVCMEAFGAPAGSEVSRFQRPQEHPKTRRIIWWHVAEIWWQEVEDAQLRRTDACLGSGRHCGGDGVCLAGA